MLSADSYLRTLTLGFVFIRHEQFEAHEFVAFAAHREPLSRFEGGFVGQPVLGV